jgi:simple sugar transport system permease protein
MLKNIPKTNEMYLIIVIIIYSIIVTIVNKSFMSVENVFDILRSGTGQAILGVGVLVVLLSGGIDVSFTAIAISSGYISVRAIMALGIDNLLLAFIISCTVGLVLGAINGIIIAYFKIPTLIATLGTLNLFHGLLLTIVGTRSVNAAQMPKCFVDFGAAKIFTLTTAKGTTIGLSVFVIPLIAVILLTWFLLKYTMLGRSIYAIGNSTESALRAGINVVKTQLFLYCYVGFINGIMGVITVSEVRWVNPVYLVGTELTVIAAVVIGGAKLTGGSGTIVGALLGVGLITILNSTLVLLGLSSSWMDLFVGAIMILSIGYTSYQRKIENQRLLNFM